MPRRHDPDAPMRSVVLLGEVAEQFPVLDVACTRCDRRGRLYTSRLVAQHGADMPLLGLLRLPSADCPRRVAGLVHDPCGARFPDLVSHRP